MSNAMSGWYWPLDGWIVVIGVMCAVSASLLGNFLVLRRMSLLGDAISHAVLPGLAAAFFLTGSRSSLPMFLGAVLVGVLTAMFTQWIRNTGNVDEGASMGVVFTSLFALGLIMIVRAADSVDLDPGCVLYGAIEFTPIDLVNLSGWAVPRVFVTQSIILIVNAVFVVAFYKELKISSFDPALATTLGFNATLMHYLLMTLVAVTAVASFESVGNILVVAMFVVPPATALLMTDRLRDVILFSTLLAAASAVLGHLSAISVPHWFGFRSTSTAGMMAVVTGCFFVTMALVGAKHGVLLQWIRRRGLAKQITSEDVIALLYREEERDPSATLNMSLLGERLDLSGRVIRKVVRAEAKAGRVVIGCDGAVSLTEAGRIRGRELVRSHRLWESYLVQELELPTDRIHDKAEKLEHFTDRALRARLNDATATGDRDPHGSPIPPEEDESTTSDG
ncbi:MAG: metal ABC transporter permease [Pirellulaceae bacterium]